VSRIAPIASEAEAEGEQVATDFFGRIVKTLPEPVFGGDITEVTPMSEPPRKRFRAAYKFHEGSSCAVRKNVRMSTLM
jgi:chromosome transmission fidelity protein 18